MIFNDIVNAAWLTAYNAFIIFYVYRKVHEKFEKVDNNISVPLGSAAFIMTLGFL